MAEKFYQGARRDAIANSIGAVGGPDMSAGVDANKRRTEGLIAGLDGLVNVTSGAITAGSRIAERKTKEAVARGTATANTRDENGNIIASTASTSFWSGEAEQKAYEEVRGQNEVANLPDYVQADVNKQFEERKAKNPKLEFDDLTDDERNGMASAAQIKFMQEKNLVGTPYEASARAYGDQLMAKTTQYINGQARNLKEAKKSYNVTQASMSTINTFKSPQAIDEQIELQEQTWKQSMNDLTGAKTQTAIMQGVLSSVMQEKPNLDALVYLNSPEAQKRFGGIEGFDKAKKMADKHTTAYRKAEAFEKKTGMENQFYQLLNVGELTSEAEVDAELASYPDVYIDQKDKFILKAKALKHIGTTNRADDLQLAISSNNFGVVNAAKEDVRLAAFERNVMSMDTPVAAVLSYQSEDPRDPTLQQQKAFMSWMQKGFNPPQYIKQNLNTEIVPTFEKNDPMNERLVTHQKISRTLGRAGVSKLFTVETQTSIDMYNRISNDTSLPTPEKKALAYNKFVANTKETIETGRSPLAALQKEVVNDDFIAEMQSFAQDGGGDTTLDFGVPSDLQPFLSTRNNSDTDENGYAMTSLRGNYLVYRNAGIPKDDALRKAKDDFLYKNYWVDFKQESVYAPREFGSDFAQQGMNYAKSRGFISQLAEQDGVDPDMVEARVAIKPSFDYQTTRKMAVFYKGVEQPMTFTFKDFSKHKGITNQAELDLLEKKDFDKRNSPEFKAQHEKKTRLMKSLERMQNFRFGMN